MTDKMKYSLEEVHKELDELDQMRKEQKRIWVEFAAKAPIKLLEPESAWINVFRDGPISMVAQYVATYADALMLEMEKRFK